MAEKSQPPQLAIEDAIHLLQTSRGPDLKGTAADGYSAVLTTSGAKADILRAKSTFGMGADFADNRPIVGTELGQRLGQSKGFNTRPDRA